MAAFPVDVPQFTPGYTGGYEEKSSVPPRIFRNTLELLFSTTIILFRGMDVSHPQRDVGVAGLTLGERPGNSHNL